MSDLRLGAHVSISDGLPEAVDKQLELGGTCGQLFVGSPRGWAVSDIAPDDASAFIERSRDHDIGPWIVHGTYLINLATPKDDLAEKSVTTLQGELDACAQLEIPYYTFHPGAHTGAGVEPGIANVADRIEALEIPPTTTLLLENTAGSGTTVGQTFDQLGTIIRTVDAAPDDVGVCLDTCHLFAAGYEFGSSAQVESLVDDFDDAVGLEYLHYLHLNDSKHPLGSEKDEHEHIGEGEIGDAWFEHFVTNDTLSALPMVLETPVGDKGYAWNIDKVTGLYGG